MKITNILTIILLLRRSIIGTKGSELEEKSTFCLQKREKAFEVVLDAFRKIKEVTEDCKTGSTGCLIKPSNCAEWQLNGFTKNGIYDIYARGHRKSISVYCDFKTDGGGWTVFQRRGDFGKPKDSFLRNWKEYKMGFGDLDKEFWLGNEKLFILTSNDRMTMRVDLEDYDNDKKFAVYKDFVIEAGDYSYKMTYKSYSGNAGDSLSHHAGHGFATFDNDNVNKCAANYKGGWWYNHCHHSNLNGLYFNATEEPNTTCTNWSTFKADRRCMKKTEMKLRPNYFEELQAM